jgi:hypothetical protein
MEQTGRKLLDSVCHRKEDRWKLRPPILEKPLLGTDSFEF